MLFCEPLDDEGRLIDFANVVELDGEHRALRRPVRGSRGFCRSTYEWGLVGFGLAHPMTAHIR